MARFPKSETGLSPLFPVDLQAAFDAAIDARDAATAAQAAAEQATTDKQLAFEDLIEKMKDDLHYADLPAAMRCQTSYLIVPALIVPFSTNTKTTSEDM